MMMDGYYSGCWVQRLTVRNHTENKGEVKENVSYPEFHYYQSIKGIAGRVEQDIGCYPVEKLFYA